MDERKQHVFQNVFYDTRYVAPNWAYDVYIQVPFENGPDENLETDLSNAVTSVKIPQRQIGVYTSMFKGLQINIPTRYENTGVLEIKFAENSKLTVYKHLVNSVLNRSFNAMNYYDSGDDKLSNYINKDGEECTYEDAVNTYWCIDAPFNCYVGVYALKNKTREYVQTFSFFDCYCESISDIDLDYSKTDDIVEYSVNIHYNRMNVNDNLFKEVKSEAEAILEERRRKEAEEERRRAEAEEREERERAETEKAKAEADAALKSIGIEKQDGISVPEFKRKTPEERAAETEKAKAEADDALKGIGIDGNNQDKIDVPEFHRSTPDERKEKEDKAKNEADDALKSQGLSPTGAADVPTFKRGMGRK